MEVAAQIVHMSEAQRNKKKSFLQPRYDCFRIVSRILAAILSRMHSTTRQFESDTSFENDNEARGNRLPTPNDRDFVPFHKALLLNEINKLKTKKTKTN